VSLDRALEDARQRAIPWDDLRERRVLSQLQARAPVPQPAPRIRRGLALGVAFAAAAALVLAFVAMWPTASEREALPSTLSAHDATPTAQPATPAIPHVDPAQLLLADGSRAQLGRAAGVQVVEQTAAHVALQQTSGRVRYEVNPDRDRDFVVDALGVQVRVVGTVFSVDVESTRVTVTVERGIVEVESDGRTVRLTVGDTVQMPIPDSDEIVIETPPDRPRPSASRPAPARAKPSIDELLAQADAARAAGDAATAADALDRLVAAYPKDPRAVSATFQLGKVERSRGRHAAAARAFERCVRRSPSGALAEDARAEAAVSWDAAGDTTKARAAARTYLDRYPSGTHAGRMRRLAEDPT
jgi:hypothetical protein